FLVRDDSAECAHPIISQRVGAVQEETSEGRKKGLYQKFTRESPVGRMTQPWVTGRGRLHRRCRSRPRRLRNPCWRRCGLPPDYGSSPCCGSGTHGWVAEAVK